MISPEDPRVVEPDDLRVLAVHQELTARDHVIGLEAQVVRLEVDLERARDRIAALRAKVKRLEGELVDVRQSRTWKIGRAVTGPLGRLRG